MSDTTATEAGGVENAEESGGEQQEQKTYTQADIDRAVRERLARERAKFADYDELKSRAEGAKTLEQRFAELEQKNAEAEARALRSDIAARYGISAEDRDLFLTGTDADTLEAQAKRLAARDVDRKKQGNTARSEGKSGVPKADDERQFVRSLFGGGE